MSTPTIADAVDLYLRRPGRPIGRTSWEAAKRMEAFCGTLPITKLDQPLVDTFVLTHHAKSKANTIRRELAAWQAVIHVAAKRRWCTAWIIDKPPAGDGRLRCLEPDEIDRFMKATPEWARPLFAFLFNTGARLGEALSLQWSSVSANTDAVVLATRKSRNGTTRQRRIPLNSAAKAAVEECASRYGRCGGQVFRDHAGKPIRSRFVICRLVRETICPDARLQDFTAHDCRHTFASHLVRRGVHLRTVADLLGHSNVDMVLRYTHMAPTQHADAVSLLP